MEQLADTPRMLPLLANKRHDNTVFQRMHPGLVALPVDWLASVHEVQTEAQLAAQRRSVARGRRTAWKLGWKRWYSAWACSPACSRPVGRAPLPRSLTTCLWTRPGGQMDWIDRSRFAPPSPTMYAATAKQHPSERVLERDCPSDPHRTITHQVLVEFRNVGGSGSGGADHVDGIGDDVAIGIIGEHHA
jgi:hypothetical protein